MSVPNPAADNTVETTCSIAGGGPAGMMLGFLLARAGVDVQVLEKHADFLRDFRGDTIHPSTFDLMYELGIPDDFLRRPHQAPNEIGAVIDNITVKNSGFLSFADAVQVRRSDAAMGFSEFPGGEGARVSRISPPYGSRRPDPRKRACVRRPRKNPGRRSSNTR